MTTQKKSRNSPPIDGINVAKLESVQGAWDAEILRRIEDLDSGQVTPMSHDEALRRLSRAIQTP